MYWEGIKFFNYIEKYWCMRFKVIVLSLIRGVYSKINVYMYNYGRCFFVYLFLVDIMLKKIILKNYFCLWLYNR